MTGQGEKQRQQEREEMLEARLKRDLGAALFEDIWEDLRDDGYVEDALEVLKPDLTEEHVIWLPERSAYRSLLERGQELTRRYRRTQARHGTYSGPRPGRKAQEEEPGEPARVELNEYEQRCTQAYSEYLGTRATKRPDVLQFRAFTLGGAWPTGAEAGRELEKLAGAALLDGDEALTLVKSGEHQDSGSGLQLRYAADDGAEIFVAEVQRGSVLDRLRSLSERLAEELPWHPADAARWLLTGISPAAAPIRSGRYRDDNDITITALPFVDARTVTASYRKMQRLLKDGDNQRVSEKALAVLLFVEERISFHGGRPDWPALKNEWNTSHPDWSFRGENRAGFKRRYEDAYKALIGREPPPAW